jgi:uncharacterized membrane protein (DUF4010 family)
MNLFNLSNELRFAVAIALGFLIGLERETTKQEHKKLIIGGVRTFPIISMIGFGCGWLFKIGVEFILPAGFLTICILMGMAYFAKIKEGRFGITSEVTALLTFLIGALSLLADIWIPMALGIINALLLSEKSELENYVAKLDKVEFLAVLKFLLVTLIIYPVLPNEDFTLYKLNPARIWQIIMLVSSIGFVGYYMTKKFGSKVGLRLSGIMGGIVSSTAVAISSGRIAQKDPSRAKFALQASILASSVMYLRILVLIWIINFSFVQDLWWRLLILSAIGVILSFGITTDSVSNNQTEITGLKNPFEIKPALIFAILFIVLTVVSDYVKTYIGNDGLLSLSIIVGITDIDPFILSIVNNTKEINKIIFQSILIAMMSNTIVKSFYFAYLSPATRKVTLTRFSIWTLLHLPFILL